MKLLWFYCFYLLHTVLKIETAPLPQISNTCEAGKFYPDPGNCSKYFICSNGQKVQLSCPPSLVWDNALLTCSWSSSSCQIFSQVTIPQTTVQPTTEILSVATVESLPLTSLPATVENVASTLQKNANFCEFGKYYSDPSNCSRYFICDNGQRIQLACPPSLKWDINLLSCVLNSNCENLGSVITNLATTIPVTTPVQATLPATNINSNSKQKSYEKATQCDQSKCKLPNCRCASEEIPGNLSKEDVPQIVMWTMDDSVNDINYKFYSELFDTMKNPNGCPVGTTYYVSAEYTNFANVKSLFQKGHEIADHSLTHKSPSLWWRDSTYSELEYEIIGQKKELEKTGAKVSGWRNPFLRPGETTYRVLADNNFLYDTSLASHAGTKWWPYTLDYLTPSCVDEPCPELSYPGLWEVPLNPLYDGENGTECSMFDSCVRSLTNSQSVYNLFMYNFNRHYKDKKQPFALFGHAAYFLHESFVYRQEGFKQFLSEISRLPDVYFVTVEQAVRWTQNPTPISKLNSFEPWSCNKK